MKQIVLSFFLSLIAMASYSQKVFKEGTIVKGKTVTYQVRKQKVYGDYLVRNMDNPDTTLKPLPQRSVYTAQEKDIEMQIAEIIHANLTPDELSVLKESGDSFGVILRVDEKKHKLLQVTCFSFDTYDYRSRPYDGFWLNFDPDRLYKIEREIVEKVELPDKMNKSYLTDDFKIIVSYLAICDVEKARAARQKAIKGWKKKSFADEEMLFFGPPIEL